MVETESVRRVDGKSLSMHTCNTLFITMVVGFLVFMCRNGEINRKSARGSATRLKHDVDLLRKICRNKTIIEYLYYQYWGYRIKGIQSFVLYGFYKYA